jgi:DNA primase large subunit
MVRSPVVRFAIALFLATVGWGAAVVLDPWSVSPLGNTATTWILFAALLVTYSLSVREREVEGVQRGK